MKKIILSVAFLAIASTQVNAQETTIWDKISLEASYGAAAPLSPNDMVTRSEYVSFVNFQGGINYQMNNLWGVRATYAYQQFENENNSNLGVQYHKFMAEATFNTLRVITPESSFVTNNTFDVVAHAGIGASFATRTQDNATNKMLNAQIGLKPSYTVSPRITVIVDGTYVMNFNQAYAFNGMSIKGGTTGSYVTAAIGIQVKLGK